MFRRASGITTVSVVGRNALDAFGQQITGRRMADVAQSEDADHPFALVDHRQPARLQLLHVPHRFGEVIVIAAAMDAWGHHIPRRRESNYVVVRMAALFDFAILRAKKLKTGALKKARPRFHRKLALAPPKIAAKNMSS